MKQRCISPHCPCWVNAADVGMNLGTPVSEDYVVPFRLSGKIERVTIDLGDRSEEDRSARSRKGN